MVDDREKLKQVLNEYEALREHVANRKQYLKEYEENLRKERSKDVCKMSTGGGGLDKEELIDIEMAKRIAEFERTEMHLKYLDSCFKVVKKIETKTYGDSDYFKIIEKKYFEHLSLERVAQDLNYSDSNVKHHHRRLLKVLCVVIYGKRAPI